ncbi:type I-B CRISPR-associated endonuclease Cas1b [Desulfofundulus thermosubterraneus]|uniref:CRISPR-associated endonuclease Cas1 n=1 Tax=Desulfofundulus thermosubterraneus DSM 16057 TaxID=1121432 RepID=A0A1M6FE81_9FIRM|nr:type I-B CRISPR-associated endonuclease Cas1b [Desulfofundulus thermosubterraneus]SHI96040.1 CRISPR-associated protein, Cas1 family [Desulfofundulus thermosubterraneus DSM 16057]
MQKTLYLFASGRLKRKDNTVCVESEEGTKYFPVTSLRDIVVFGEVDLNKKLLEFMQENEVILHFFGHYGNYVGSFYPREHYNSGYVILRQAEHYLDPGRRLNLARKFVEGALANILQVLRYYQNRGKDLAPYIEPIACLAGDRLPLCGNIEELMAIEGNARAYYYDSFNIILEGAPFVIKGRSKRPPADPLNALISFGNSLIYTKVLTEIYKTHLDPRIGYLHATNFRRFTLNLDVAEIFKPIFADRVLFTLVGKKMIGSGDFERHGTAVLLKESGRRLYVKELEDKLQTTFYHRRLKRNVSYQTLIRLELYKLEKHLIGEETYEPFVSRW